MGTPEAIIKQLNVEVVKILNTAEMQKSLPQHGIVPAGGSPRELGSHLCEELQKWSVVVKDAGIKVD